MTPPPAPSITTPRAPLQPGLLVLHGNRAEALAETVVAWTLRHPLQALEEDVFLVQSNGVAEWLKMVLASQAGVCAATRVELPGRFLWRAYRQVLGRDAVPAQSALDKQPLAWRLMQQLPQWQPQPGFEPLASFLRGGDVHRRWQLAQQLADLFDQYQVYRSDWLDDWAQGRDQLRGPGQGGAVPLPEGQRWQALLWRAVLAPLTPAQRATTRPQLHTRFLRALDAGSAAARHLPRRVVLFGMTHVPMPTLQALAAMAQHTQVLLAIPNPCRYHWADILDGRELLQAQRRRQPLRGGRELAAVPLEQMHAHAHPLLAAWGRQSRDFVRQLDLFDDVVLARERFPLAKVDLFDDAPGSTLLEQVQARIRDLVPMAEQAALNTPVAADDRSIVFHVAHGAQREVEVLHDQLLELLAHPPGDTPLAPRDIAVMVPDIETFAPAIRSVFGAYGRGDPRHIPFDIADLQERGHQPLLVAIEWLARLPQQRCRASELRDLLDVPAVAARFGIAADSLPRLTQWMAGAGIRWGLDAAHRAGLGLGAAGEQNSALFGLRRMLLGYASGAAEPFEGVVPYAEVGGLEAALAGSLAALLQVLSDWRARVATDATPVEWAVRWRWLVAAVAEPTDDAERAALALLEQALDRWLQACEAAGFDAPVPLAVARDAWLGGLDAPALNRRFRAGGVTFCTLLPMRSIPFQVVCLLGMNEGDYPRSSPRSDFDLMALPGQARPGDRSRRDDDRQLMLEALLSARRVLYLSWAGRSARDNSALPPSVLVSQLRDHLAAGWGSKALAERTTEHPLQPFSRRYFEAPAPKGGARLAPGGLFTHAREWRTAHEAAAAPTAARPASVAAPEGGSIGLAALAGFLRNPVQHFFKTRLGVTFEDNDEVLDDEEVFAFTPLQRHALLAPLLRTLQAPLQAAASPAQRVQQATARLRLAGALPLAGTGLRVEQELTATVLPMLQRWDDLQARWNQPLPRQALLAEAAGWVLDDWLDGLQHSTDPQHDAGAPDGTWLQLLPQTLATQKGQAMAHKLVAPWVRMLAASACGLATRGVLVGTDAVLTLPCLPQAEAQAVLLQLLHGYAAGQADALPLPRKTALAHVVEGGDPAATYDGSHGRDGESAEPCLQRLFPDHAALVADGRFAAKAGALYGPLARWAERIAVERLA
jgi:exodeoxyribonuclease V gamma subunit